MTFLKTLTLSTLIAAGIATTADAAPFAVSPAPTAAPQVTLVRYGYGQLPYGIYGHRHRFRTGRSYGTGYHGRGTRTGGPAGGLPGRS